MTVTLLKGKMDVRFPANIAVDEFLTVLKENGTYTFGVDYTLLDPSSISDPSTALVAIFDQTTNAWKVSTLSALVASTTQIVQTITAAGPANILPNAGIVRVNQTSGAPITLNLPAASAKTSPVLISDWKGDAGTNNINVSLTGSDRFPGNLTSWKITNDTGSIFLRPISGVGYAL